MNVGLYAAGLITTLTVSTVTWLVSIVKRDVSIVDAVWAVMIAAAATVYAYGTGQTTSRTPIVMTLVALWALRLSGHIMIRSLGAPEDHRYRDIRKRYEPHFGLKSLAIIFWLQAGLAWVISMPLWAALTVPVDMTGWDVLAVLLWVGGMFFEAVGDWQLSRFKADAANAGKVMDRGLWRYTRHPNYFGECLVWWGFYLLALPTGAWWTAVGPLLLTYMLLQFSGVSLLEQTIVERRPAYRDYMTRTNAFIPGPSRGGALGMAVLVFVSLSGLVQPAWSATSKSYDFNVFLGQDKIGHQHFEVISEGQRTQIRVEAKFTVTFLYIPVYTYRHTNVETWDGACLQEMRAETNDNGKAFFVHGTARDGQLQVQTQDGTWSGDGCFRSFAYWNQEWLTGGRLLNSQTGELQGADILNIGQERIAVHEVPTAVTRRRIVTAKFTIDLWYTLDGEWVALQSTTAKGEVLRYALQ
ncbi:MAG TPA: DUF6134 family protein [Nitrospiraceae bacterium]|nr:DUF6134 family protein [Nitrospiraceae bacterium]